jgi:hypothetical protein
MVGRREVRLAHRNLGRWIHFADGTSARVYRDTVVPGRTPQAPCFLAVSFRLRMVRGRGHWLFRMESILNTPLFVGFPGFVSKLWLTHDERGVYRGLYEWDGEAQADNYARCLWRVLALVSDPGSIDFHILPGCRRESVLAIHDVPTLAGGPGARSWWRVVSASPREPWS